MSDREKTFVPPMISIPEGAFRMGSEDGPDNEKPVHSVWVDRFLIGKFPITRREYRIFMEALALPEPPFWNEEIFAKSDQPVVGISWHDAVAYCEWLSRTAGTSFRLPTEAEWERAARGGLEGKRYPWGDESPADRSFVGYDPKTGGPQAVGQNEPNGFGLYDMSESVHEWCADFYDSGYYARSPERNPRGPAAGERRSSRGGSWRHRIKFSRCSARSSLIPAFRYADYGFRVAADL
jgi:formylglycine-generating enzyme required for sulfatase activity